MNNLNYCLACGINIKPIKSYKLPKSLLKINQANQKINPKFSKLINQLINQKYA